jgi:hypothetical protein
MVRGQGEPGTGKGSGERNVAKGRAVVLEMRGKQAVLLDETGLFRHVPSGGRAWQVGDEVWLDLAADGAEVGRGSTAAGGFWARGSRTRGLAVAAACAVLLAVGVPLAYQADVSAQTVAIVTVDVNPSVQLDLNSNAQVLRAVALDSTGSQLLRHVHVQGEGVAAAIDQLTSQAAAEGFVPKTETVPIVIAAAPAASGSKSLPPAVSSAIQGEEQRTTAAMTKAGYHVQVAAVSAAQSDQASARALKLSLGRYLVYQAAKRAGVPVTAADLQKGAIIAALRRAGATEAVVHQLLLAMAGGEAQGVGPSTEAGGQAGRNGGESANRSGGGAGNAGSTAAGGQSGMPGAGRGATGPGQGGGDRGGQHGGRQGGNGAGNGAASTGPGAGEGPGQAVTGPASVSGTGAAGGRGTFGVGSDRGQGSDLGQGASQGPGVGQGTQQAPEGWPERIWQEIQGLFHARRDGHQGSRGDQGRAGSVGPGFGSPIATATATVTATASPTADGGGPGRRRGQDQGQGH